MALVKYGQRVFFLLMLILLTPLSRLLAYNWDYFNVSLSEIVLALLAAVVLGGLVMLSAYFVRGGRESLVVFLSIIFVTAVASVHLLPISLSVIDGGDGVSFVLRAEAYYALLAGFVVFIAYLVLAFFNKELKKKVTDGIDFLVMPAAFYVLAFTSYAVFNAPSYVGFTGSMVDEYKLPLSREKNVFIIGFDQVQGSLMHGLLKNDPDLASAFDGFVFYADAASTYPNTNYSLSSIMLGRAADNQTESHNTVVNLSESLLVRAKQNGSLVYTVKMNSGEASECLTCVSNSKSKTFNWIKVHEAFRHAMNLAFGIDLNRLFPLPDRLSGTLPADMLEYAWKLDLHKFDALIKNISIRDQPTSLFFMHHLGTHQPFSYTQNCEIVSKEILAGLQNPAGALNSATCIVAMLETFFNELKSKGLYDSSTIIIYSDHGYEENINRFATDPEFKEFFGSVAGVLGDSRNIKPAGAYNPMLFFKPANSSGRLIVSKAPVSLIDIAPTVCAVLGCAGDWEGMDLSAGTAGVRQREFWMYLGGRDRRAPDGRDKLHDGLDEFWEIRSFEGPIYPQLAFAMGLSAEQFNRVLKLQQPVAFTKDGESNTYIELGWSGQESTHRWTDASEASLSFTVEKDKDRDLVLRFDANAYLGGGLTHQAIRVVVNGEQVTTWKMAERKWHEALIPAQFVKDGKLQVAFHISNPTAPCEVSDSKDCRKLGIAARELVIDYAK